MRERSVIASEEIEQGFVSIALMDPRRAFSAAVEVNLTREDFYWPSTNLLFDIVQAFWIDNEPLNGVILITVLSDRGELNQCGGRIRDMTLTGAPFITELESLMPTVHVAESYAEIIKKKAARRKAIERLGTTMESAYDASTEDSEFLMSAENALIDIVKMREGQRMHTRTMKELVLRSIDRLDKRIGGGWSMEFPTGIRALDKVFRMRTPGVTMALAKPSDGKTSFSLNVAEHLVFECGKKVGIISMDDSDDQINDRLMQARARVNLFEIEQTGHISTGDRDLLMMAGTDIANVSDRLFIRDDGALTPAEISATLTAWKSKHGLDFVIIDHIQLAQSDKRAENRTSAAEDVSRSLKPMAKRLNVHMLVLSQVSEDNSGAYSTKNTKALGEDANGLLRIKRTKDSTDAWIEIGKQKDGPRNVSVPVKYEEVFTRFSDRDKEPEPEQPELVHMGNGSKRHMYFAWKDQQ